MVVLLIPPKIGSKSSQITIPKILFSEKQDPAQFSKNICRKHIQLGKENPTSRANVAVVSRCKHLTLDGSTRVVLVKTMISL